MKTALKGIPEKVLMKSRNIGPVLQWQNGVTRGAPLYSTSGSL